MQREINSFQEDAEKITNNMTSIRQQEGASHNHLTGILNTMLDVSADVRNAAFLMKGVRESPEAVKAMGYLQGIVDLAHESRELSAGLANQDLDRNISSIAETSEAVHGETQGVLNGLSGEVAQTLSSVADLLDKLVDGLTNTLQTSSQLNELATATEGHLQDLQYKV